MSCQSQIEATDTDSAITCPNTLARQMPSPPVVLQQVIALLSDAITEAYETGDKATLQCLKPVLTKAIGQITGFDAVTDRREAQTRDDNDTSSIRRAIANAEKRLELARLTAQLGSESDWRVEYQIKKNGAVYMGLRHRKTRQYMYLGTVISAKKK